MSPVSSILWIQFVVLSSTFLFFLSTTTRLSVVDAFVNRHPYPLKRSGDAAATRFILKQLHEPSHEQQVVAQGKPSRNLDELLNAIDGLFPPQGLQERMALSRKDGYWPFIQSGEEPPQEFVYGEFDVTFFCSVLDRARDLLKQQNPALNLDTDAVFCDMGSGTGRLVLAAAAWHSWKLCRGVELLEGIHDQAVEKLEACRNRAGNGEVVLEDTAPPTTTQRTEIAPPTSAIQDAYWKQYQQYTASDDWLNQLSSEFDDEEDKDVGVVEEEAVDEDATSAEYSLTQDLPLSPIDLSCGSFDDPYEFFGDSNIIFVFSTAMPYHILVNLARAVGRQCMEGCLVITTEYQLPLGGDLEPFEGDPSLPYGPYELELVESFTGPNTSVGGESTVFIHRVTRSYGTGEPFVKPKLSVSDYAYQVVQDMDAGTLTPDPKTFLRNVSNQMAFIGLPDHWRPKLE